MVGGVSRPRRIVAATCLLIGAVAARDAVGESREPAVEAETLRLRRASLEQELANHERVLRVGIPVATAAVDLCDGRERPYLGVVAATRNETWKPMRLAAEELWGVGAKVRVVWVEPGSPADRAGIRSGDELLSMSGRDLHFASDLHDPRTRSGEGPIPIEVRRGDARLDVAVDRRPACVAATGVLQSDVVNAWMQYNGRLTVTSAMLRWLGDDDLAIVIGHEIAHFLLRHRRGQAEESEADYLGLYLAARAGYAIDGAAALWRRFALLEPGTLDDKSTYSHPSSPKRSLALARTIEEIQSKMRRGEPLMPSRVEP